MNALQSFTVIYTEPDDITWQGFNCMAEDADHAEEQCLNANPNGSVLWVNTGHNNLTME